MLQKLKAEENKLEFLRVRFQQDGSHSKRMIQQKRSSHRVKKDFESSKNLKIKVSEQNWSSQKNMLDISPQKHL